MITVLYDIMTKSKARMTLNDIAQLGNTSFASDCEALLISEAESSVNKVSLSDIRFACYSFIEVSKDYESYFKSYGGKVLIERPPKQSDDATGLASTKLLNGILNNAFLYKKEAVFKKVSLGTDVENSDDCISRKVAIRFEIPWSRVHRIDGIIGPSDLIDSVRRKTHLLNYAIEVYENKASFCEVDITFNKVEEIDYRYTFL